MGNDDYGLNFSANDPFQSDHQRPPTGLSNVHADSFPNYLVGNPDLNDYEHDGRRVSDKNEPPGPQTVHIAPGNPEKEIYRIRTFFDFPEAAPVDPCVLARHGFLYTGCKDKVKCFSCGASVLDWCLQDDPKLARWHFQGCKLVMGEETRNKPLEKQPIEFVGTFTSCLPTTESGYSSAGSSSLSGSSSSSPSSSNSSSLAGSPPDPSSPLQELPPLSNGFGSINASVVRNLRIVAADDEGRNPQNHVATDLVAVTNSFDKVRIDQSDETPHGSRSKESFETPMRSYELKPGCGIMVKVKGLQLASVCSSTHLRFINEELDLHKEADRIKSYIGWMSRNVTIEALAKSGLFYLGNNDRVQCFSCSLVLRNWRRGDDVDMEHRRNNRNCKMMLNLERRNIPLPNPMSSSASFNSLPDPSAQEKEMLKRQFPCLQPVNPHMRNYDARLQTFDRRWPSHKVLATKDHIAKAGFFFLGDSDRAKCWYCNGGLQNWDPEDEPFTEHAKWFPGCEFVLQCKGLDFVKDIVSRFPNLRRPTLAHPRFDPHTGTLVNSVSGQPSRTPIVDSRMSAGNLLMNYEPSTSGRQSPPSNGSDVAPSATSSPIEKAVEVMGFSKEIIQRAVTREREERGRSFQNAEELVEAVLALPPSYQQPSAAASTNEMQNGGERSVERSSPSAPLKRKNSIEGRDNSSEEETIGKSASKILKSAGVNNGLCEELEQLENERKCKACYQHQADTVIIPCGHLSICSSCSSNVKKCPVCRIKIQSVIKVFLS